MLSLMLMQHVLALNYDEISESRLDDVQRIFFAHVYINKSAPSEVEY